MRRALSECDAHRGCANSCCSGYTDENEIRTLRTDTLIRPASLISRERMVAPRALASAVSCRPRATQNGHADGGASGAVQPQLIGAHLRRRGAVFERPQLQLLKTVRAVCRSRQTTCQLHAAAVRRCPMSVDRRQTHPRPSAEDYPTLRKSRAVTPASSQPHRFCDTHLIRCPHRGLHATHR